MHDYHRQDDGDPGRQRRAADILRWLGCQLLAALMAGFFVYINFLSAAEH